MSEGLVWLIHLYRIVIRIYLETEKLDMVGNFGFFSVLR